MFEKIKFIRKTEIKDSYDIEMQNTGFKHIDMQDIKSNFVANSIICKNSGGDARSSMSLLDTFEEFKEAQEFKKKYSLLSEIAVKLEGNIRHKSSHAAAMVLSEKDISEYSPINKIGGVICSEWEKALVEDASLIKFDILGLKNLTIIKDACDSAKVSLPEDLNDSLVYEKVFKPAKTVGIFQFNTVGMQKFSEQLNISNFGELSDACTLFRPGSLHSGSSQIYANRKNGLEEIKYVHPLLEPITKSTQGIILYQEQVMSVMNSIGKFSWSTAEQARKIITKSKGKDAFEKMRREFVENAYNFNGLSRDDGEKLYDAVCQFGSYSYNKTHAYGYSMISYYCAWLKTYYPQHFYKALLKFETNSAEIQTIIQDASKNDISIDFPDINKSAFSYEIYDNKIYAGLNSIIGVGGKIAEKIISGRPYSSLQDFKKRCKVSEKITKALIYADAFRQFKINKRFEIENFNSKIDANQKTLFAPKQEQSQINKIKEDYSDFEQAQFIYEFTTLTPKINIRDSFNFGNNSFVDIQDLSEKHGNKKVFVRGIITDILKKDKLLRKQTREHIHKFEQRLLYLNLNDGTGNIACQAGPETFEKYKDMINELKKCPVKIFGTAAKDGKKIFIDLIQVVEGKHKSFEIDKIFNFIDETKKNKEFVQEDTSHGEAYIISSKPMVSKNNKSYYRVVLSNSIEGLCFRFDQKLFPGLKVRYNIEKDPFINLEIIS